MTGNRQFVAAVALAALALAAGYDGFRLLQESRFNSALAAGDAAALVGPDEALSQFAIAYEFQRQRDFRNAVKAYAAIDPRAPGRLRMDVQFNLANLYFREARRLDETGADDLAMPLLELAKENYRDILRTDSAHWDAKFNLELALVLAPDTDPIDAMEERNPEHSPRALTKVRSREPLP